MGAESSATLTLVWIHKLVYCISPYHDQPRPPRRLALTVETKRRQIKGACSKVYFKNEIKPYDEKMEKYNILIYRV